LKQTVLVVGIDVSKEHLNVSFFDGKTFTQRSYENSTRGILSLIDDAERSISNQQGKEDNTTQNSNPNIHFVMEATGSYHMKCAITLSKRGYLTYVLNPLIIKRFSEEALKRAKTDKEDSKMIVKYAYSALKEGDSPHPQSYSTLIQSLFNPTNSNLKIKLMVKAINQLFITKTRILNQIEALRQYSSEYTTSIITHYNGIIEEIDKVISDIEDKLEEIMLDDTNKVTYKKLLTIPGVGKRVASAIISYFGRFELFETARQVSSFVATISWSLISDSFMFETARQVSSFVGLTPLIEQSGKKDKKSYSISRMGTPYLRQLLFMAALSASRHNLQCRELYDRLVSKGKPKKVALNAVANKLLRQIFAIVKYERRYDPHWEDSRKSLKTEGENILDVTIIEGNNANEKRVRARTRLNVMKAIEIDTVGRYLNMKVKDKSPIPI
jgi:transposase